MTLEPNKQPKVLICVDWFVPGYKAGGPIQSCKNLVLALKDSVDFYILTSNVDWGETQPYPDITPNVWLKFDQTIPIYYASKGSLNLKKLEEIIKEVRPDVIYLNSMFSVRYTIFPLLLKWRNKIPDATRIILAPRGMLQPGALSLKPLKKSIYLKLFKWMGLPKLIEFHATDKLESERILKVFPGSKKIHVIGNFPEQKPIPHKDIVKIPGKLKLVYASRISKEKNLDFIFEILLAKNYEGEIELIIAGQVNDGEYYQKCREMADKLPDNIKAKFLGPIPHDHLVEWLQSAHYFVLPTFGENFGHSIFEAFLAGRPVIISDRTLWKGLELKSVGWDIPLDNKNQWIEVIDKILRQDQKEFDAMAGKSRNFAINFRNAHENREQYLSLFL